MADRRRTPLAVHDYPDDETITTGGILARYSAEGVRTVVVTRTGGELGLPGDRQPDLERAARVLGVTGRAPCMQPVYRRRATHRPARTPARTSRRSACPTRR